MEPKVMKIESRVFIDGVKKLGWGNGKETTYIGALESALSVTDRAYSYEQLMATSGLAFRARWWRGEDITGQQFCPSSPVGEFETEIKRVSHVIGWEQLVDVRFDWPNGQYGFEKDLAQIRASIDLGVPVLCYGRIMDVSVVFGYIEDSDKLLLMDYHGKPDEETVISASEIGPMMIFLGAKTEPSPRDEWLPMALSVAVENYENEGFKSNKPGMYHLGEAAINQWIEDLDGWNDLEGEHKVEMFHPHWWTFSCLHDARLAATNFLKCESLDPVRSGQLSGIIAIYQEQVGVLGRTFRERDVFLGPWTGRRFEDWNATVRKNEVLLLEKFLELEREAISRIREFLLEG